jgi:hypothetical protein
LNRHASHGSLPHAVLEELSPAFTGFLLGAHYGHYFLPFSNNKRVLSAASSLNPGQSVNSFLLAVDLCEPTW